MMRQILLTSRPSGMVTESNFLLIDSLLPQPGDGEVLVRTLYLSVDPYMRGRMNDRKSYVPPFELNKPMVGGGVGEVVESKSSQFKNGDVVFGFLEWADYCVVSAKTLYPVHPNMQPVSTSLGVLGMPGLTAYFGLLDIGKPKEGETVVISGAAGAVGTVVGQIAKIKGCRVLGIAGSDEKINYITKELGFDAGINYKTQHVGKALDEACPKGVDIYFDNVGGDVTDEVLMRINRFARVVLCGQIAMYNLEKLDTGPRNLFLFLINSALLKGFIVRDYEPRYAEGLMQLLHWHKEGKLKHRETIVEGLENAPKALIGLFKGENTGKQIVKIRL